MSKPPPMASSSKKPTIRVMIVDDIAETRENLRKLLAFEQDMEVVGTAASGREAIKNAKDIKPDIILMDINMPDMDGIQATEALSADVPTAAIIIMSVQSDADYLRRAMLAGARQFLTKPISGDDLYATIHKVYELHQRTAARYTMGPDTQTTEEEETGPAGSHVIVVYSPSGGAGTTTIAINLAASLMSADTRVLLVDTNLQFPDITVCLNLKSPVGLADLAKTVDDIDLDLVQNVITTHDSGLPILLGPPDMEAAEMVKPESVSEVVEKLAAQNAWDFIIVDSPKRIDNISLGLFDVAERIIMVTTPHLNSIQNSRVMLDIWEKLLNYPPAKIMMVLNKHRRERGGINVESIENHFKRQFNMIVPSEERAIEGSVRRGVPVVAGDRNMSPAKEFIQLAEVVRGEFMEFEQEEEEFELEEEKTSLFGGLFRR